MQSLTITADPVKDPTVTPPESVKDTSKEGVTRVEHDPSAEQAKPAEEQPKKFAGKYNSPEELEKAYKELEAKLGKAPEAKPADAPAKTELTPENVQQVATDAGLDLSKLTQEYAEKGELSQEAYTKLAAKGIDKATVDAYVAGQKALGEQYATKLAASVGGADALDTMMQWATSNMTPQEIAAFNKATASMDIATAQLAVDGLHARYVAAVGSEPTLVNGAVTTKAAGVEAFSSNDEVVKAMSDPRYKSDPSYRAKVYQRMEVTNSANWIHN